MALDLNKIAFLTIYGQYPPQNELERRLGTTRLGTPLFRIRESLGELRAGDVRFVRRVNVTRRNLRGLRDVISAQESAFLVLLIPGRDDLANPGREYQTAVGLMEELDIQYLNPAPLLDAELDYALRPEIHWNNAGHQKVGALLSECIKIFIDSDSLSDCEHVTIP